MCFVVIQIGTSEQSSSQQGLSTMKFFAADIIEAAKSAKEFDKANAKEIASYHNVSEAVVREEIVFVRKNLSKIDPIN
jgi:hypothetical protein